MKTLFLLLVLAMSTCCFSQSLTASSLQAMCPGAMLYSTEQQSDLSSLLPPYNSLLYAKSFQCVVPVACSLCKVTLGFFENRIDSTLIGPKQRLFTVTLNGGVSDALDLFTLAGPQVPYLRTWIVLVYDGKLRLSFAATALNALISTVAAEDALVPGIQGPPGPTGPISVVLASPCSGTAICIFVDHEAPAGAIDGANTMFMLAVLPVLGSEHVYVNGLLQTPPEDYAIAGPFITFTQAPAMGSMVVVAYRAD